MPPDEISTDGGVKVCVALPATTAAVRGKLCVLTVMAVTSLRSTPPRDAWAVICVVPAASPDTSPLALTVALVSSLEVKVMVPPAGSAAPPGS